MENLISQSQKANESEKVNLYNQICTQYLQKQDLANVRIYANKALELSQKLKNFDEQAAALTFLAEAHSKIFCTISDKDSMQALTQKYKVTEQEIINWNSLNSNVLFIDQVILINKMGINSEDYLKAEKYLFQALEIRKSQSKNQEIWALQKMAEFYFQQENFPKSQEFYEKILEIRQNEGDSKKILWATKNLLRFAILSKSEKLDFYAQKMQEIRQKNNDFAGEFADLQFLADSYTNDPKNKMSVLKKMLPLAEKNKDSVRIKQVNNQISVFYVENSQNLISNKKIAESKQNYQELLSWLKENSKADEPDFWVLGEIVMQYKNAKYDEEGILFVQKCLELGDFLPSHKLRDLRMRLTDFYVITGKNKEALNLILQNLELFSHNNKVQQVRDLLNIALYLAEKETQKTQIVQNFSQILDQYFEKNKNLGNKKVILDIANILSDLYQRQSNYAKSIEKKLFFVQNTDSISSFELNNLAFLYQLNKNFAEAEKYFLRVFNKNTADQNSQQYWKLVNLFMDKNDLEKAKTWTEKALKQFENHENDQTKRSQYAFNLAYAASFWAKKPQFFFKALDYANRANTELSYLDIRNGWTDEISRLTNTLFTFKEISLDKDFVIHTSQGEIFEEILKMYQIDIECIKKWNYIPLEYYNVSEETRLRVCKLANWGKMDLQNQAIFHDVLYEETLDSIAENYQVSTAQIVKLNKLDQNSEEINIYEGQRLWIKGKKLCSCE